MASPGKVPFVRQGAGDSPLNPLCSKAALPNPLRFALVLACVAGVFWPFLFGKPDPLPTSSVLQIVIFGELAAVLYGVSTLPPHGRLPKIAAVAGVVLLPVAFAMMFR